MRRAATDPPPEPGLWTQLVALEYVIEGGAAVGNSPLTATTSAPHPELAAALRAEEALYDGASRDPAAARTLTDAATRTGDAEAITAVTTDLGIMHASQLNVAAAASARSELVQLDSLSSPTTPCTPAGAGEPLLAPTEGSISQPFGPSDAAFEPPGAAAGVSYPHYHTGIDLAVAMGTPIYAAAGGVVVAAGAYTNAAGQLVGYGRYIAIDHAAGCSTLYGHLLDMTVVTGDHVTRGELIGHAGSTGNSTGPHLHFEVRLDGTPVDPMPYLGWDASGGSEPHRPTGHDRRPASTPATPANPPPCANATCAGLHP